MNPAATDRGIEEVDRLSTLRFITCGSVDDGKSTLIGRLLFDQGLVADDHLAALEADSRRFGTLPGQIDFSLLLDGLEAEREQAITIDVAYRYFSTSRRSFIVADAPGHEQYTRNMVTGASNSQLALILVDGRKGLLPQTFRHTNIVSLLGIRHIVLVVNKMDLLDFDAEIFEKIKAEFITYISHFAFLSATVIPVSARFGDNIISKSSRTPWFDGLSLLEHLETIDVEAPTLGPFRMWVQWVNRPHLDFRGYSGTVASGLAEAGMEVIVLPSGQRTRIGRIVTEAGDLAHARVGSSVTVTVRDDLDIARGDVIAQAADQPKVADQFAAHLIWLSDSNLLPGRPYILKIGSRTTVASVTSIKHQIDPTSLAHVAVSSLSRNEIAFCNIATVNQIVFEPYGKNRDFGAFILIDRDTNETVAAGMISFELHRSQNVRYQALSIDKSARAQLKRQRPAILWFTGLPGAGKSTIANLVDKYLFLRGAHTAMLDGDNIRHGLNKDLGFTDVDRVENVRRVGEVAKLMSEAGLIVLCALISPFRAERRMVRELVPEGEFIEIFVDTPLDVCIRRDPKGLYKRALAGELSNFTGISQAYEPPEQPEMTLVTEATAPESLANAVVSDLIKRRILADVS